jgi:uncharacterized LabA/DUF88 family protein
VPNDRVMVFIDGSNLEMSIKTVFGNQRIDPIKLSKKLSDNRRLMKINYYEAPLWKNVDQHSYENQQRFFEFLRNDPFVEIRLGRRAKRDKEYECPKCGHKFNITTWQQKGVDSLLTFDLIAFATRDSYDNAIIIAGDQDFACPALEVRMMGKQVENAFIDNTSWSLVLKAVADKAIILDDTYLSDCWR